MEISLKSERPCLTVNAGDCQYKVPLTFNRCEFEEIGRSADQQSAMNDFFAKYLGDIYDQLGDDDLMALYGAWANARRELGAPSMGEPSASPQS